MNASRTLLGLYAITPPGLSADALLRWAGEVLAGGAAGLQYRAGPLADPATARALRSLCAQAGAWFIVNDDPALAGEVDADGVHLGRADQPIETARAMLGPDRLIGVSCYDDLDRAAQLARLGADYLAFGSLYPSPTKPEAVRCSLQTLRRARALGLPVVAIGGITLANARRTIDAGADLLAVISDLAHAPDPRGRAAAYASLFTNTDRG